MSCLPGNLSGSFIIAVCIFPSLIWMFPALFQLPVYGMVHLYLSASKSPALPRTQTSGHLKTVIWHALLSEQAKCANYRTLPFSCWSCAMPNSRALPFHIHWIILMHAPADNKVIDDIESVRRNLAEQQFSCIELQLHAFVSWVISRQYVKRFASPSPLVKSKISF